MAPTANELLDTGDKCSERETETNLAIGAYRADKRSLAELALTRKRLAHVEATRAKEMQIAHSATDAAWESARAAKGANTRATWAIMISIISIAIAAWEQVWSFISKAIVYLETLSST